MLIQVAICYLSAVSKGYGAEKGVGCKRGGLNVVKKCTYGLGVGVKRVNKSI